MLFSASAFAVAAGLFVPSTPEEEGEQPAIITAPAHRAIIYRPHDKVQVLLLQPAYCGPERDFCWIIPVPDRPGGNDVFPVSQDFMDAVFERTAPVDHTEIIDPTQAAVTSEQAEAVQTGVPKERPVMPTQWLSVGDYGISRPSKRNCKRLVKWLGWAGYTVTDELAARIDEYNQRDWRFVVIKAYPRADGENRVVKYLKPIGIRVATDQAIYPLGISRGGGPGNTALKIVVMAPVPVTCEGVAAVDITERAELPAGESYENYRARLARGKLAREAVVKGACPFIDLHYESRLWTGVRRPPWNDLWATRFVGVIPTRELVDLTFQADPSVKPFQVHVTRTHTLPADPRKLQLSGRTRPVLLVVYLLIVGLLIWASGLSADQRVKAQTLAQAIPSWAFTGRLLVYSGALLLGHTALLGGARRLHLVRYARLFTSGQVPLQDTVIWAAAIVLWALMTLYFVAHARRSAGSETRWIARPVAALTWLVLAINTVFLPPEAMRDAAKLGDTVALGVAQLATLLAITAFASLLGHIAQSGILGPRRQQMVSAEFCLLLAALVVASPFVYRTGAQAEANVCRRCRLQDDLKAALTALRQAVADFERDYACLPPSLKSLTSRPAARTGQDAAGNTVPVQPQRDKKAYLAALPDDPLTGSAQTWLYSALMPERVTSGGFISEVTGRTGGAEAEELRNYWQLPRATGIRQALGPIASMIWGEGDAILRMETENPGGPVATAVTVGLLRAATVTVSDIPGVDSPRLVAVPGTTTMILSSIVSRRTTGDARTGALTSPRTAIFEVANAGRRLTSMGQPIAGQVLALYPSPDGVQVACIVRTDDGREDSRDLWALGDSGKWEGPLAENVAMVAWHPGGISLYALVSPEENAPGAAGKGRYQLVRVWLDGRVDQMASGERFAPDLLASNGRGVFASVNAGVLKMIDTRGRADTLATGVGNIRDFLCLSAQRTAALIDTGTGSKGGGGKLIVFDRRGRPAQTLEPVAPKSVRWSHGRIVGLHEATGYFFLHLWENDPHAGSVVLVGADGAPPQKVGLASR